MMIKNDGGQESRRSVRADAVAGYAFAGACVGFGLAHLDVVQGLALPTGGIPFIFSVIGAALGFVFVRENCS